MCPRSSGPTCCGPRRTTTTVGSHGKSDPGLDEQGRPIGFLEMSLDQTNPLWARSIELAHEHSPLAEHLVAWHFLALRAAGTSSDDPAARQFTDVYRPRSEIA